MSRTSDLPPTYRVARSGLMTLIVAVLVAIVAVAYRVEVLPDYWQWLGDTWHRATEWAR